MDRILSFEVRTNFSLLIALLIFIKHMLESSKETLLLHRLVPVYSNLIVVICSIDIEKKLCKMFAQWSMYFSWTIPMSRERERRNAVKNNINCLIFVSARSWRIGLHHPPMRTMPDRTFFLSEHNCQLPVIMEMDLHPIWSVFFSSLGQNHSSRLKFMTLIHTTIPNASIALFRIDAIIVAAVPMQSCSKIISRYWCFFQVNDCLIISNKCE